MARKHKKKRKLKLSRVFLVLFILAIIGGLIYLASNIRVRGFYISGNTYYTDNEILEMTKLNEYPSFIFTTSRSVTKNVKKYPLIKSIDISRTLNGMFNVTVIENKILFYDNISKKSVLEDNTKADVYYENSPVLINEIKDTKIYDKFIKNIKKLNEDIIKNISEIKYDPNDIDKERFLFSMNDGNYVYVTLSKISNINNYLEISNTLGEKNGVLYLDYGNYFVPKE